MNDVKALVLTGYGLNCDHETAYALKLSGAAARRVHINALIDGTVSLKDFQIMVFGGGFSWGDDHGAGVVQAVRMKTNLGEKILEFIDAGKSCPRHLQWIPDPCQPGSFAGDLTVTILNDPLL